MGTADHLSGIKSFKHGLEGEFLIEILVDGCTLWNNWNSSRKQQNGTVWVTETVSSLVASVTPDVLAFFHIACDHAEHRIDQIDPASTGDEIGDIDGGSPVYFSDSWLKVKRHVFSELIFHSPPNSYCYDCGYKKRLE